MHAESEEYAILAQERVVALVANAQLTSSSTFRSRRDWSERGTDKIPLGQNPPS